MLTSIFRTTTVCIMVFSVSFFSNCREIRAQDTSGERERLIAVLSETLERLETTEEPAVTAYSTVVADILSTRDPASRYYRDAAQNQLRWLGVREYLAEDYEVSPYWIGVQCEPVEEVQLLVEEDTTVTVNGGLLVSSVVKDSPAEAAGVRADDVILYFNKNATTTLPELVNAINGAEGSESMLSIVRDMNVIKIELEPALRETEEDTEPEFQQALLLDTWGAQLPEGYSAELRFRLVEDNGNWWEAGIEEIETLPAVSQEYARLVLQRSYEQMEQPLSVYGYYDLAANDTLGSVYLQQVAGEVEQTDRIAELENKIDQLIEMVEQLKADR